MFTALLFAVHTVAAEPAISPIAAMAPEEFLAVDCGLTSHPSMCQTVKAVLHALTRYRGQPIGVRIGKCARAIAGAPDAADVGTGYADATDTCRKVASAFDLR